MTSPLDAVFPDPMRGAPQSFVNQTPEQLPAGLTKREHFAVEAMKGLLSNPYYLADLERRIERGFNNGFITDQNTMLVMEAVDMADELINRLNETNQ